ncbi:hypothetical protein SAV14893_009200 [Streptomyces avermitilis]|uniref:Uncharacterized protein n=1 Tax=Streptomyces avermitilis TaxID=33903 RepID=A0A4D4N1J4_STRAX|nr:hypothetical protein SAVMC3_21310 [Streptomyces avermitilis]GDY61527.1 hypothetical protein SAV14893_009200 [Streptomyces avermitilis]GDY78371.1 hypothetical protein SAV31267_078560 [Streptomyces avermitilis]
MEPGEHPLLPGATHTAEAPDVTDLAVHQGHLLLSAIVVEVTDGMEIAVHGGQGGIHDSFDT